MESVCSANRENKTRRRRSSPDDRWVMRAAMNFVCFIARLLFTLLPRSLSRESPARHNVAFLLPFVASVRPPRQAVGTAARTPLIVRAGLFRHLKKARLSARALLLPLFMFLLLRSPWRSHERRACFQTDTGGLGAPHSPRNSPHVWGLLQRPRFHRFCHAL